MFIWLKNVRCQTNDESHHCAYLWVSAILALSARAGRSRSRCISLLSFGLGAGLVAAVGSLLTCRSGDHDR